MMTLERYFIFSSYTMFTTGYVMLASTRQLDVFSLGLFAVVLGAGWLIDTGRLSWSIGNRSANWLMAGGLAFLIAEWYALGVSPVTVTLHFVFFAAALKLLRRKASRDWIWLYVVTFCQVLMTAGMMVSTTFLLLVIVYLFAATSAFIAYEMRRSASAFAANNSSRRVTVEYRKENNHRPVESPRLGSLPVFSACALAAILLLAAPIFLAMPRVSRGFSRSGMLRGEALSGFSDSVRLGEVAQVKLNPQVVMRVRVKFLRGTGPRTLRWRGVTLDNYDGQTWNYTGQKPALLKRSVDGFHLDEFGGYKQALQSQTLKSGVDGFHPRDAELGYGDTEQRFFLEPLAIDTVFVAPEPRLITGLPDLARDQGDGLWTAPHDYYKLDYTALSDTSEVSDERLAQENSRAYPSEIQRRYLQLPDNHDRRIDELAAEVTRGATTNVEIARKIEKHLRTTYGYTLDLRRVEDGDPVADFLFNTREGHCEYFASAMVLMLRARRVPARIVNGFQAGEYNEAADVYTVRQSDAHSWVEVYFPLLGQNGLWVAFDPTPDAGRSVYGGGLAAWLRHRREAMEMFWLEHVVGFDANKQFSLAGAAQRWVSSVFSSYKWDLSSQWVDWVSKVARQIESRNDHSAAPSGIRPESPPSDAGARTPALAFSVVALLLAAAFSWRRYGRSWRRNARHDGAASAVAFYQEMLRALERAGHKRALHQTPGEYAEQLRMPAVAEITTIYQQVRFGDRTLGDDEIARVSLLLREVRRGSRIEKGR
jgi:protein-glutamine gamma-glutamyltransferase